MSFESTFEGVQGARNADESRYIVPGQEDQQSSDRNAGPENEVWECTYTDA